MDASFLNSITSKENPETRIQLIDKIGSGSYGEVYRAIYRDTGEILAVKIIPVEESIEDILTEVQLLSSASSSSSSSTTDGINLVTKYMGSYLYNNNLWVCQEFCDGGSLADIIFLAHSHNETSSSSCYNTSIETTCCSSSSGGLDEETCRDILAFVVKGLVFLHDRKIAHRDLKAGNILLTTDGQAKLGDFGVSVQLSSSVSRRKSLIGTVHWMAPEVIQEKPHSPFLSDIWSLGITILEMVDGSPPYSDYLPMRALFLISSPTTPPPTFKALPLQPKSTTIAAPTTTPTPTPTYIPSSDFQSFLAACLSRDPSQRSTAKQLLSHPFLLPAVSRITADGGRSMLLADLVDTYLPQLQQMRRDDVAEKEHAPKHQPKQNQEQSSKVQTKPPETTTTPNIITTSTSPSSSALRRQRAQETRTALVEGRVLRSKGNTAAAGIPDTQEGAQTTYSTSTDDTQKKKNSNASSPTLLQFGDTVAILQQPLSAENDQSHFLKRKSGNEDEQLSPPPLSPTVIVRSLPHEIRSSSGSGGRENTILNPSPSAPPEVPAFMKYLRQQQQQQKQAPLTTIPVQSLSNTSTPGPIINASQMQSEYPLEHKPQEQQQQQQQHLSQVSTTTTRGSSSSSSPPPPLSLLQSPSTTTSTLDTSPPPPLPPQLLSSSSSNQVDSHPLLSTTSFLGQDYSTYMLLPGIHMIPTTSTHTSSTSSSSSSFSSTSRERRDIYSTLSDPSFLSRLRPNQLRAQLQALEVQYGRDMETLKEKYRASRQAMEKALSEAS